MKKIYSLIVLLTLGYFSGIAQLSVREPGKFKKKANLNLPEMQRRGTPTGTNHSASVAFYDDFSNPSTWIFTHGPGTTIDWVIGLNPPGGQFPIDEIFSETSNNGFALFDSDLFCDPAGHIGEITMAQPADLSSSSYVRLKFSQYYRRYADSTFVFVSNDNANWTKFPVNTTTDLFGYSNLSGAVNPDIVYLDISSVAANQDSVYVRFQFYSPTSLGPNAGCGFAWMIDDVYIEDIPDIDATVDYAYAGEYSIIPVIQPEALKLRGKVVNKGRSPFTGAKIIFGVYDPFGGYYVDSTAASGTVAPGDTSAFLTSLSTFLPPDTGSYFVMQKVVLANDSDMTNDSTFAFIYVNDSLYSRDYLYWSTSSYAGTLGLPGTTISFGEIFNVYHASQFTSAFFYLSRAILNDEISVSVYDVVGGVPNSLIGSSTPYTITANDTGGSFITIPFSPAVSVGVGDYFVCVNQLDTNRLSIGFTDFIYTPQKSFYNIAGTGWRTFEFGGLTNLALILWVSNPSSTLVNVKEQAAYSAFSLYPNPTSGKIHFANNKGVNEKNITIKVFNNLGALVKTASYDFASHGSIDLSGYPAGVYTLNIATDAGVENKTVVLQ